MDCSPPDSLLCPWDSPDNNTGVGCHFLFQGIFPIQGRNLRLWHWQVDSLPLSHLGSSIWHLVCNYFLNSIGFLFILLMISFTVQMHLSLMLSSFLFLLLMPFPEETDRKKVLLILMSKFTTHVFFLRVMVSVLRFKSLIYFDSSFTHGVRKWSSFIFCI